MSTKPKKRPAVEPPDEAAISHKPYKAQLHDLQIEFVKLQRHLIRQGNRILVLLEGRDSAGKDGSIKRIVAHLSPRDTHVVALGKPSDGDLRSWYFERYVGELPKAEELVLFNRSWYNRAGVERVMGFCSKRQFAGFMQAAPRFERMLVDSGIKLLKYHLDILSGLHYAGRNKTITSPDRDIVFEFTPECLSDHRLAR